MRLTSSLGFEALYFIKFPSQDSSFLKGGMPTAFIPDEFREYQQVFIPGEWLYSIHTVDSLPTDEACDIMAHNHIEMVELYFDRNL